MRRPEDDQTTREGVRTRAAARVVIHDTPAGARMVSLAWIHSFLDDYGIYSDRLFTDENADNSEWKEMPGIRYFAGMTRDCSRRGERARAPGT